MRKTLTFILCLILLSALAVPALAANQDLVYTKDATLHAEFVMYRNITVKSGAHVTVKGGFEIAGDVVVEPGASFTGVQQAGQFTFSLCPGATVTGVDLWYPQKNNDGSTTITRIPVPIGETWGLEVWSQMNPSFKWNTDINGWCLTRDLAGNPFHVKVYHSERDMDWAKQAADSLNHLGLFRGTGTNADGTPKYELNRAATREEALVMLIRLLGKENEARSGSWEHPFTDVSGWADCYVGYAYETGLTTGSSATKFGKGNVTAQQYMTFLLRALGYSDADTASTLYQEAMPIAERLGLLTEGTDSAPDYPVCRDNFWRADAAVTSLRALEAQTQDGRRLYEVLTEEGVFTPDQYNSK